MDPATTAALISAGGGLVGGLLSNEENIGPGDLYPKWMRGLREDLAGNIGTLATPEYFQGQLIANQNPWLQNALGGMAGWGGGLGGDMLGSMYGAGTAGLGGVQGGMDYLNQMQQRGPNTFGYDQGAFDQVMGNLAPGVQNMFDVNARQMQQGYDFNVLPGLNMAASQAGGYGGSKALQQSALGQAMNAGNIQNMGVNLWQNAANQANQAGYGAGMANLGSANQFDQRLLGGYGNMGQLGGNLLGQGFDMGLSNLRTGLTSGQIQQGYDQSLIDAEKARWDFAQQAPWIDQQNRLNMMKQFEMGTVPQNVGMSPWEGALQGAMTGLGIYGAGRDAGWWGQPDVNFDAGYSPTISQIAPHGGSSNIFDPNYILPPMGVR